MPAVTKEKTPILRILLLALACVLGWHWLVERQANVALDVQCSAPAIFKLYWLDKAGAHWSEDKMRRVNLKPERIHYDCKLTDLGKIAVFRIDPTEKERAQLVIKSITISQRGYAPIHIAGETLSHITPIQGVDLLLMTDDGLVVHVDSDDAQLGFDLAGARHRTFLPMPCELPTLLAIFLFVSLAGLALARFGRGAELVPLCLVMILALAAVMATISRDEVHPDETMHVRASRYFEQHWLPPQVGAPEILDTYSVYGVSRLHSGEIAYFFLGKFARLTQSLALPDGKLLRYFNVTLLAILVLLALPAGNFRWIMVPFLLSPQIWYIFSYVNSEAFAVFVMMLTAWQLTSPTSHWNRLFANTVEPSGPGWLCYAVPGLLLGLLLLAKQNFYFFLLFIALYFFWQICFGKIILTRRNIRRFCVVALIGFSLFALIRGTDAFINDFHKSEKLLQARYQYAAELWNPATPLENRHAYLQMRERGTSMRGLMFRDHWGAKSFQSSFGLYGATTVGAALPYYRVVQYVGFLLLLAVTLAVLVHGGWEGVALWGLTLLAAGGLIAVSFYHAWTVDFQPQGRYFLPIIGMLAVFFGQAKQYLFRSLVPFCCAALFLLSLYSFICVGLFGILKPL